MIGDDASRTSDRAVSRMGIPDLAEHSGVGLLTFKKPHGASLAAVSASVRILGLTLTSSPASSVAEGGSEVSAKVQAGYGRLVRTVAERPVRCAALGGLTGGRSLIVRAEA